MLTDNYDFSDPAEKQRVGRFWGGNSEFWEGKYVNILHVQYLFI